MKELFFNKFSFHFYLSYFSLTFQADVYFSEYEKREDEVVNVTQFKVSINLKKSSHSQNSINKSL